MDKQVIRERIKSQPDTLGEFFADIMARYGDKPALTCLGRTLSYKALDEASTRVAQYLHFRLGLQAGDRLAIQLPNLLQYPVVVLAAFKLGLVVVNTNPLYTDREPPAHRFPGR